MNLTIHGNVKSSTRDQDFRQGPQTPTLTAVLYQLLCPHCQGWYRIRGIPYIPAVGLDCIPTTEPKARARRMWGLIRAVRHSTPPRLHKVYQRPATPSNPVPPFLGTRQNCTSQLLVKQGVAVTKNTNKHTPLPDLTLENLSPGILHSVSIHEDRRGVPLRPTCWSRANH